MFHLLFDRVNRFYEHVFHAYGTFLARRYAYVICGAVALNVLLSLGLLRLVWIEDVDYLFLPVNSEAKRLEQRVKTLYNPERTMLTRDFYIHQLADMGTWAEVNFQTCANASPDDNNILQSKYMQAIVRLNEHILARTVVAHSSSGQQQNVSFESVCARRFGQCNVDGSDLLSVEFYERWLRKSMQQKMRSEKERAELEGTSSGEELGGEAENNDDGDENKDTASGGTPGSASSNEFRFYVKLGGAQSSLTDLSFSLGKEFRIQSANDSLPGFARVLKLS